MPNPATAQDVADRWRPFSDTSEEDRATVLLEDAWSLLLGQVTDVEDRLEADPATLDERLVVMALVRAVVRVLRNPNALRQVSLQDYSETHASGGGDLYIDQADIDLLTPSTAGNTAFTIVPYGRPGRGYCCSDADCCC
jgi:hypothetical protein